MKQKIAIFASGSGSNAENIIRYFKKRETAVVKIVISNKSTAYVLERADKLDVPSKVFSNEEWADGTSILQTLEKEEIDWVILAGFLKKVPENILYAYTDKIINIHPALLPKYGGKGMYGDRVHRAVVEAGEKQTGITIHRINKEYDKGAILFQAVCPVDVGDTPEEVAAKVHQLEYTYFPLVIESELHNRILLNEEHQAFVQAHSEDDVRKLALETKHHPNLELSLLLRQVAGRQLAKKKLPTWAETSEILYPPHLNLEQCSSEWTAKYKAAQLIEQNDECSTFVDLTGGFGVDATALAAVLQQGAYVEQNPELCLWVNNNLRAMGIHNLRTYCATAEDYLKSMDPVDVIYVDPARRSLSGNKVSALADCTPNVIDLLPLLLQKAKIVLLKLSPMLDLTQALSQLPGSFRADIVSVDNECKELLIWLSSATPVIAAKNVPCRAQELLLPHAGQQFSIQEEAACKSDDLVYHGDIAKLIGQLLYEPNAAVMKGGAFYLLATHYQMQKLDVNTHLYVAKDIRHENFPGRCFRILAVYGFDKASIKRLHEEMNSALITVRNFPMTPVALRARLKLKDGGEDTLFATTVSGKKILIRCTKIN